MIKKAFLITVCLLLLATPVHAQQKGSTNAGILPTSPLYPVEQFFEKLGVFITFTSAAKAERLFLHSEERFAEAEALLAMGEIELAGKTVVAYEEKLAASLEKAAKAEEEGQDVTSVRAKVQEATVKHQKVLERVYEKAPEKAKPALERAREKSRRGHETSSSAGRKDEKEQQEKKEVDKKPMQSPSRNEVRTIPPQREEKNILPVELPLEKQEIQLPEKAQKVDETVHEAIEETSKIPVELPQKQGFLKVFGR